MPLPPPDPIHVLRSLLAQASHLSFSPNNERLYAATITGRVIVTSTRTLRPIADWVAHEGGVLTIQEWYTDLGEHVGLDKGHQVITSV
jgi:hypothetical protein